MLKRCALKKEAEVRQNMERWNRIEAYFKYQAALPDIAVRILMVPPITIGRRMIYESPR